MNTLALGPSWLDPDYLLNTFGLPGLLLIVFAESGLLIGFFLPGDSLLFTTGLLVTTGDLKYPLWLVCLLVALAAIIGDQVGYLFGRKVGPSLFKRPDSRLFKQENVEKAHDFFEKYGPKSLVLARFVPVVRTFTPIIAGVSRMDYRSFITFNIIGGVLWGVGVTLLGAALGNVAFVHENIEMILILIVLISVVPILIEFLRARGKSKKEGAAQREDDGSASDGGSDEGPHGGAGNGGQGPTAHRYADDRSAPYDGGGQYGGQAGQYDQGGQYGAPQGGGQYGTGQGGQQTGGQYGAPQGGGQYGAPQGGAQYGNGQYGEGQGQYGTGQGGQYSAGQYAGDRSPRYDGGQAGQQYGQAGGQYGEAGQQYGQAGQQYGQGGAQYDQGGQYGQAGQQYGQAGGQYGQAGQQYGQAGGQYEQGGQYGQSGQYGQAGQYGSGQAAPYDGGHDGRYGGGAQPGPYADGGAGPQGDRPRAGQGENQEGDPGRYGWQDGR
ncbi:DedA family protein [Streptomyces sp. NPDC057287]|uniref:DedA family protein n=1 Tax=Streptomyces sp. NPDC057287 TaxID=3346086 RepID=UPI00363138F1